MADAVALGRALRSRRLEAGLSQRALGAPDYSASFVSLVEAGKRRVTAEALRTLCSRLGTTPQALVGGSMAPGVLRRTREEVELDLAWAKIAIRAGNPASAETYARLVLEDSGVRQEVRLDALRLLAAATEGQGRVEEAIAVLEQMSLELDPGRTRELWLSVQVMRMRCSSQVGDVDHAIDVGSRAMARLGARYGEQEAALVVTLADAYRHRGDLVRARMLLSSAISRAEQAGSPRSRGTALWNASLVAADEGRLDDAVRLSEQALAVLSEGGSSRSLARLHANCGDVLLDAEVPDAVARARRHYARARDGLEDEGSLVERGRLLGDLARCDLLDGDADAAEESILAARVLLEQADGAAGRELAFVDLLAAQVLIERDDVDAGLAAARRAARTTTRHDSAHEAARTWRTVAEMAREHGRTALRVEALEQVAGLAGVRPTRVGRTQRERAGREARRRSEAGASGLS